MEIKILLKLMLSALLGGIIGLEREKSHKEAGLRTNILIAMSSTLITVVSIQFGKLFSIADPSRIAAQIVTGIGFLGAGAIIQARFVVHGLTTAATIWTVAAIGMAVGAEYYLISLLVTILVVVILVLFKYISNTLEKQKKIFAYMIKTEDQASILLDIKRIMFEEGIKSIHMNLIKKKNSFEIDMLISTSEQKDKEFVEKVMQLKGVKELVSETV